MHYGAITGIDVIKALIISDGDKEREDRLNIFNPVFTVAGVYSGTINKFGHQSCITYADSFIPTGEDPVVPDPLPDDKYDDLGSGVEGAINSARTDPSSFVKTFEAELDNFNGVIYKKGDVTRVTKEGAKAVQELIDYLKKATPVKPVKRLRRLGVEPEPEKPKDDDKKDDWKETPVALTVLTVEEDLAKACKDHIADIGELGAYGHVGSDGSGFRMRLEKYGTYESAIGENLLYGLTTPNDIVLWSLISDGDPTRSMRNNIMNPNHKIIGTDLGKHSVKGSMSCNLFADTYTANPEKPDPVVIPPKNLKLYLPDEKDDFLCTADKVLCQFNQTIKGMPTITEAKIVPGKGTVDTIHAIGTDLDKKFFESQKLTVSFGGIEADEVELKSDKLVIA